MIVLDHISAHFGAFALRDISLRVEDGGYCVLLGPPGSGKTSLIEVICGLRPIVGGSIALDGKPAERIDPADRHVGYVPQDYALFTALSVRANIAFGLSIRHCPRAEIEDRVRRVAGRLKIEHLLGRSCRGLSGGERQRVALGRAIVLEPKILLLDEPVSALDESTRQQVCLELRRLHDALGMTTIHISHNIEETRAVADQVVVLNDGRIAQAGPAERVFREPDTEFVARFLRAGNVLRGNCEVSPSGGKAVRVRLLNQEFTLPAEHLVGSDAVRRSSPDAMPSRAHYEPQRSRLEPGPVALLFRPHESTIHPADQSAGPGWIALPGTVVAVHDDGGFQATVRVAVSADEVVSVSIPKSPDQPCPWKPGDAAAVSFQPDRLRVLAAR